MFIYYCKKNENTQCLLQLPISKVQLEMSDNCVNNVFMSNACSINNIFMSTACVVEIADEVLTITITENIFNVFKVDLVNDPAYFANHKIICDTHILHKILTDCKTGSFESSVKCGRHASGEYYVISLNVHTQYIEDTIDITIPKIKKTVKKVEIIKHVAEVKSEIKTEMEFQTKFITETLNEKFACEISKEVTKIHEVYSQIHEEQRRCIQQLTSRLELLDMAFIDYKLSHPILFGSSATKHLFVRSDCTKLTISQVGCKYYLDKIFEMQTLMWGDVSLLEKLEEVTLIDCSTLSCLKFLQCQRTLRRITLINLTMLSSIAHLASFDYLERIELVGNHCISDMKELGKCRNLREMIFPKGQIIGSPFKKHVSIFFK